MSDGAPGVAVIYNMYELIAALVCHNGGQQFIDLGGRRQREARKSRRKLCARAGQPGHEGCTRKKAKH